MGALVIKKLLLWMPFLFGIGFIAPLTAQTMEYWDIAAPFGPGTYVVAHGGSTEMVNAHLHTLDEQYAWELVVVDDGSTDETGAIADAFAASRPEVRVLHHKINFNLGQALRYAFGTCRGDYVVTLDCDGLARAASVFDLEGVTV